MSAPPEPSKSLLRIAAPLVLSFTLRFLFTLVDMGFAAVLEDGKAKVAAIAFYAPLQTIAVAVWVGLSAGFTAALSAAFGSRDEARVVALKRGLWRILAVLLPLLLLLGIAVYFAAPHLGLEPAVADAFRVYATTIMVGMPLTGFWSIYPDSIVKAHHATRSTMVAGLMSTAANVALNAWFVFGLDLGLFGIALATVLSRLAGLGYAARRAAELERDRRAPGWDRGARPWPAPVRAVLGLAVPGALAHLLAAAEGGVINKLLTLLPDSTTAIASWGVYERLLSLAIMPAIATSVAIVPYVARLAPQGERARIRRELGHAVWCMVGASLVLTALMGYAFAAPLAGFFVQDEGGPPSALTLGALRLLPIGAIALVPFFLLRPVFEGMHRPRLGVLVTAARYLLLSMPLCVLGSWLAPRLGHSGLHGLILGLATAGVLASALAAGLIARLLGGPPRADRATGDEPAVTSSP